MSGHHARPRPSTHPAIWAIAAAAISLLAVAACGSTTTTTASPTTSAVAALSPGPGGHWPTLIGAGSTFDAPFFAVAFTHYQQQHPGVTISYAVVGSSAGIAATAIFHGMTVDAVSDLDLSYTPPLGSPWEAVQMGAQAWVRATRPH